jgi:hypothetical protein
MTDSAHAEMRKRIARRLSNDEWMEKHFGISCHAGDIADAVLELFKTVEVERFSQWEGVTWPPDTSTVTRTRLVLRTAIEEVA